MVPKIGRGGGHQVYDKALQIYEDKGGGGSVKCFISLWKANRSPKDSQKKPKNAQKRAKTCERSNRQAASYSLRVWVLKSAIFSVTEYLNGPLHFFVCLHGAQRMHRESSLKYVYGIHRAPRNSIFEYRWNLTRCSTVFYILPWLPWSFSGYRKTCHSFWAAKIKRKKLKSGHAKFIVSAWINAPPCLVLLVFSISLLCKGPFKNHVTLRG